MSDIERVLRANLTTHAAAARRAMGLDVGTAARLAGVDPGVVDAIERGTADRVAEGDLARLARFLGLTADGTPRSGPPGRPGVSET